MFKIESKYCLQNVDKNSKDYLLYYYGPLDSSFIPVFVKENDEDVWIYDDFNEAKENQSYLLKEWKINTDIKEITVVYKSKDNTFIRNNTRYLSMEELNSLIYNIKEDIKYYFSEKKKLDKILCQLRAKRRHLQSIQHERTKSKYNGEFFTASVIKDKYGTSYHKLTKEQIKEYQAEYYKKHKKEISAKKKERYRLQKERFNEKKQ